MKTFLFLFLILCANSWAQEQSGVKKSILELTAMADLKCIDLKVLGVCPKPNRQPPVGVKVKYWQPEVFIETVKMPGDYVISEYGALLSSLGKKIATIELELATKTKPLTVTSGSSSSSLSGRNLQFNEAHIYDFPFASFFDMTLCSQAPNATLGVRYLSEIDAISWRQGGFEKNLPQGLAASHLGPYCHHLPLGTGGQCMKSWGTLYPREGFVIGPSEPVGSVIDAMRSVSIASNPLPFHIVESKLDFQPNLTLDKVQMLYPERTKCMPIGQNPALWERQSKDGHYVWIYWHQRECCV